MAKILPFRRAKQESKVKHPAVLDADHLEDDINAIMNDYSLTPANRRWILENMLADIDEQLENYRKELDAAEKKLEKVVKAAEQEIVAAYCEFEGHANRMTKAVRKLTRTRRTSIEQAAEAGMELPETKR